MLAVAKAGRIPNRLPAEIDAPIRLLGKDRARSACGEKQPACEAAPIPRAGHPRLVLRGTDRGLLFLRGLFLQVNQQSLLAEKPGLLSY